MDLICVWMSVIVKSTYRFAIQIVDTTMQLYAGAQMRGHIHRTDAFVEKRERLMCGHRRIAITVVDFVILRRVGEWR